MNYHHEWSTGIKYVESRFDEFNLNFCDLPVASLLGEKTTINDSNDDDIPGAMKDV